MAEQGVKQPVLKSGPSIELPRPSEETKLIIAQLNLEPLHSLGNSAKSAADSVAGKAAIAALFKKPKNSQLDGISQVAKA
ncbi:Uncharacterised protein [Candidatus Gugararchaeum adminiculabundum]|nr:Uncharacterised protein [Candidatus Gugararchaeum adminiculabundum]